MTNEDSDEADLARSIVGGWRLVSWTIEYPSDGRITEPFGPTPEGLLLYTPDGHMSAAMQKPGRPRLSRADVRGVAEHEKAAAFASHLAYAGRWHVEGGAVVHEVELAMNPNLVGTRQVRMASLAGDRLELRAEEALETPGAVRLHRIRWRRASGA